MRINQFLIRHTHELPWILAIPTVILLLTATFYAILYITRGNKAGHKTFPKYLVLIGSTALVISGTTATLGAIELLLYIYYRDMISLDKSWSLFGLVYPTPLHVFGQLNRYSTFFYKSELLLGFIICVDFALLLYAFPSFKTMNRKNRILWAACLTPVCWLLLKFLLFRIGPLK